MFWATLLRKRTILTTRAMKSAKKMPYIGKLCVQRRLQGGYTAMTRMMRTHWTQMGMRKYMDMNTRMRHDSGYLQTKPISVWQKSVGNPH